MQFPCQSAHTVAMMSGSPRRAGKRPPQRAGNKSNCSGDNQVGGVPHRPPDRRNPCPFRDRAALEPQRGTVPAGPYCRGTGAEPRSRPDHPLAGRHSPPAVPALAPAHDPSLWLGPGVDHQEMPAAAPQAAQPARLPARLLPGIHTLRHRRPPFFLQPAACRLPPPACGLQPPACRLMPTACSSAPTAGSAAWAPAARPCRTAPPPGSTPPRRSRPGSPASGCRVSSA